MLFIFRKLRRSFFLPGKVRTYCAYAIGEILLIVVGILLALQVSDWNQERIEQQEITAYAQSLVKDLERDLEDLHEIIEQMVYLRDKIEAMADYVRGKSIDEIENFRLFFYMRKPYYRPYQWNRTSLEQMKNSGALRKMKNRALAEKISVYDAFTRHLDEDFAHDRRIGDSANALANEVINKNYTSNIWETATKGNPAFPDFPTPALHQSFRDMDLPLLTNDIKAVQTAVNGFTNMLDTPSLGPRIDNEMPLLLARARELIELLKAEYPE